MELCVLASGSSGNSSVIRTSNGAFLIDCGIGPRIVAGRLNGTGTSIAHVRSVCLTHLDRDHFNPIWTPTFIQRQIRVFCPADRVHDLMTMAADERLRPLVIPFKQDVFEPLAGVRATSIRLAHDRTGSHAFHFSGEDTSIGYATDLGNVPATLADFFCGVDVLAIESNYDPQMQRTSGRPMFLQQRITGGGGHLSNAQALAAVKAICDRCTQHGKRPPQRVVLLHRSRECNCPHLVRRIFQSDPRIAPGLIVAEQFQRTEWISASPQSAWIGQQLTLSFG